MKKPKQKQKQRINPFNEVFLAETIPPEDFVSLFSPFLVQDIPDGLALFQPGNVILKGVQGSGKTMLLNLLKPEFRIAYCKAGVDLPIPHQLRRFIGAGINLTRSVAIDFGQRVIELDHDDDMETLPIFFGDFINYWIVEDILVSIVKLVSECDGAIAKDLGIKSDQACWDEFARLLARDPSWFGYLDRIRNFSALRSRLQQRISTYRAFLNYNLPSIPDDIRKTKTPIGEPISRTVQALWDSGMVPRSVPFFVRIDQYEELRNLEDWSGVLGLKYLAIINKALGTRDPRVSYRIGTRRYGWPERPEIFGISSVLELERDYKVMDIDGILRRKENRRTWLFPGFAEDVFKRRIQHYGYTDAEQSLRVFLGRGLTVKERAERYVSKQSGRIASKGSVPMPRAWRELYYKLIREDPLESKLLEAWVLQNQPDGREPLPSEPFPWHRVWWRKERIQHALMQLAWANRQRMLWAGKDDVVALSGGNTLIFVSICQHIWATWSRDQLETDERETLVETDERETLATPQVEALLQAVGIQEASTHWYNKIKEKTGRSTKRQRFIDRLGRLFRQEMIDDKKLSYPGHNGFSLRLEDLDSNEDILGFLNECVNYGDLFDAAHTTKTKDRRPRRKWYLNPVLSPHFQLPVSHVKEPKYVTVDDVRKWLAEAERLAEDVQPLEVPYKEPDPQLSLFTDTVMIRES